MKEDIYHLNLDDLAAKYEEAKVVRDIEINMIAAAVGQVLGGNR